MKILYYNKRSLLEWNIAFFMPILVLLGIFMVVGIYPFGPTSLLIIDMKTQYIAFFNHYYDVFHDGKSLLFSWEASLGMNFFGIYGYYLSSIFLPFILLFDRAHLPEAIVALTLLKVGLASLSMRVYLEKVIKKSNWLISIFAVGYALASYVIVYFQNIMWLDGLIFLPLILWAVNQLVYKGNFILLTIMLTLMFISNFYISYMVGIFTFFYFVVRCIKHKKSVLKKCVQFSCSVILATGMAAIVILPTYAALKNTSSKAEEISFSWEFEHDSLQIIMKFFLGTYDTINSSGLPYVYVTLFGLLFMSFYFLARRISINEKLLSGLMLLVFYLSFQIPYLNMAWHGFDRPNMFPYRFSFITSFFVLLLAVRSYFVIEKGEEKKVAILGISLMGLLLVINSQYPGVFSKVALTINLVFLCCYILWILYAKRNVRNKVINVLLALMIVSEISLNGSLIFKSLQSEFFIPARSEYGAENKYKPIFETIQKKDRTFYRLESYRDRRYNEPLRFDYKGIKHYSSMTNKDLAVAINELGFTTYTDKWVSYNGNTLVTDSLFGIKYLVSTQRIDKYGYKQLSDNDGTFVSQNTNALPLGFMVDKVPASLEKLEGDYFLKQQQLLNEMSGKNVDFFNKIEPLETNLSNVKSINDRGYLNLHVQNKQKHAKVSYDFEIKGNKQLYAYIQTAPYSTSTLWANGKSKGMYPSTYNNKIVDLGYYENEDVQVLFNMEGPGPYKNYRKVFYTLDVEAYDQVFKELQEEPFMVTEWSDSSIRGKVESKEERLLFLTIPYDEGWSIKVDNKEINAKKVAQTFIGIPLTKGTYQIEMNYSPPMYQTGMIISIISFTVFLSISSYAYVRFRKKKSAFQELSVK
jgi:uncharacterized membrane protein YfhO